MVSRSPSPSSPRPTTASGRRMRSFARRCERFCCTLATYFPLAFVYSLTTWAVSVEGSLGFTPTKTNPTPPASRRFLSLLAIILYLMLNTCYTVAVFKDPGSPLQNLTKDTDAGRYSVLPTTELHEDFRNIPTITVSSTGQSRYCKKCHVPKPDRAHHCSTCKRCVLKMDHHCPWLSTCLGLHNYKVFLLFLGYVSLFCWVCFIGSSYWLWIEMFQANQYTTEFAPVQVIMLAVIAGIIGLVITGFTGWHIYLACRGQTTIECLEKTRYLSGVRHRVEQNRREMKIASSHPRNGSEGGLTETLQRAGGQILEFHANAVPGASRYEEGEEHTSPTPSLRLPSAINQRQHQQQQNFDDEGYHEYLTRTSRSPSPSKPPSSSPAQNALRQSYVAYEQDRDRQRYESYLDDEETTRFPNAFDLGWRRNLAHVFGPNPLLWFLPVCNTTGDGWRWEVSERWRVAQDEAARRKEERIRQARERGAAVKNWNQQHGQRPIQGAGRHYADSGYGSQRLGRSGDEQQDSYGVSMKTLNARTRTKGRQKRDWDDGGEDVERGGFEVSDDGSESSEDSDTEQSRLRR